jgi:hypothetical protein
MFKPDPSTSLVHPADVKVGFCATSHATDPKANPPFSLVVSSEPDVPAKF